MKNNKILILLATVVVLLLVAVTVAKQKGWLGASKAIKVAVEEVSTGNIIESVSASGKIQSESEVIISPDVSGEIMELPVKEGDRVVEGQLLVKIDPDIQQSNVERLEAALNTSKANLANARSRLAQAEARLANAQASYDRMKALYEDKVISQSEYDAALSEYNVAKNEVDAATQNVEASRFQVKSAEAALKEGRKSLVRTQIYSPVSGTISKLNFEKGERVVGTSQMQGSEIMRIADLNEMEVLVEVNENDIIRVGLGDTCDIEVDAYLDHQFKGIVTNIANSAMSSGVGTDQITNFEVKVRILRSSYATLVNEKQPDQSPFRPGMSAAVEIRTKRADNVLRVPIQAVTTRTKKELEQKADTDQPNKRKRRKKANEDDSTEQSAEKQPQGGKRQSVELVFAVENGTVVAKQVRTGIQDNEYIQILSGVEVGDQVVTAPYRAISKRLRPGDEVEVVTEDELYKVNEKGGAED